jgi:hypothetical protein
MNMMQRQFRQLHIWLWLAVMLCVFAGRTPAFASCDPDKMASHSMDSCCVKKPTVCSCSSSETPNQVSPDAHVSHVSIDSGVGVDKPDCPCITSTPRHEHSSAPEPQRTQTEFALLTSAVLPSLLPISHLEVRAGPFCVMLRDGSAFPSPPRAPPFQG